MVRSIVLVLVFLGSGKLVAEPSPADLMNSIDSYREMVSVPALPSMAPETGLGDFQSLDDYIDNQESRFKEAEVYAAASSPSASSVGSVPDLYTPRVGGGSSASAGYDFYSQLKEFQSTFTRSVRYLYSEDSIVKASEFKTPFNELGSYEMLGKLMREKFDP